MKFSVSSLVAASAFLSPLFVSGHGDDHTNRMACVTKDELEAGDLEDLFPHKVQPVVSAFWNITYHNTYKILTNKNSNLSYVLYQCGTTPPTQQDLDTDIEIANFVSIPPQQGVTVATTPMISYLELLGLRTDIKGFLGSESIISSPCLLDLIDGGSVSIAPNGENATILDSVGLLNDDILTLVNGWTGEIALNNTIVMEEYQESSYAGTMEWIKVYSALFNMEEKANQLFEEANCRFDAVAENVASVTSDMPVKPKVLWAYYSDYCQGWDVAECPNYYCDFAVSCNAEILHSTEGSVDTCGVPYMTTEEFVAFGKDADHWIYPSVNWNSIYAENAEILDTFKSVQNQTVYDYQGGGSNGWFEQRFAEFDIVLNDFCLVAGTAVSTGPANRRIWFRNVFTEPVGTLDQCSDPTAPYEPRGNAWSKCDERVAMNTEVSSGRMISLGGPLVAALVSMVAYSM